MSKKNSNCGLVQEKRRSKAEKLKLERARLKTKLAKETLKQERTKTKLMKAKLKNTRLALMGKLCIVTLRVLKAIIFLSKLLDMTLNYKTSYKPT